MAVVQQDMLKTLRDNISEQILKRDLGAHVGTLRSYLHFTRPSTSISTSERRTGIIEYCMEKLPTASSENDFVRGWIDAKIDDDPECVVSEWELIVQQLEFESHYPTFDFVEWMEELVTAIRCGFVRKYDELLPPYTDEEGHRMISIVENLHAAGVSHCDICTDNFMQEPKDSITFGSVIRKITLQEVGDEDDGSTTDRIPVLIDLDDAHLLREV